MLTRKEIEKKVEDYRMNLLQCNGPKLLGYDHAEIIIDYLDRRDYKIHRVKYIGVFSDFNKAYEDFLKRINKVGLSGLICITGMQIDKTDSDGKEIDCAFGSSLNAFSYFDQNPVYIHDFRLDDEEDTEESEEDE